MNETSAPGSAALAIMREWDWRHCDPDKEVSWVATRLAMEGVRRPQDVLLTLLCEERLAARGSYRWQKYQDCESFYSEVDCEPIKRRHWQKLASSIADGNCGYGSPALQLPELGLKNCRAHEWEYNSCRFSYAVATNQLAPWDVDYLEESFSAWGIDIWPNDLETIVWDSQSNHEPAAANANRGGRPPAADWEVAALEIAGRYYRGDFKPQTIADVGRELASWLGIQDLHPSESVVRIHAKRIFDAFQAWDRE